MTGWLHIRKHFITAWYSKQVWRLSVLRTSAFWSCWNQNGQCRVSLHVLSTCSALRVRANYPQHMDKHITEFSQCLTNVLCSWCICTKPVPVSTCILKPLSWKFVLWGCAWKALQVMYIYMKCFVFNPWLSQIQMQCPQSCKKYNNVYTIKLKLALSVLFTSAKVFFYA